MTEDLVGVSFNANGKIHYRLVNFNKQILERLEQAGYKYYEKYDHYWVGSDKPDGIYARSESEAKSVYEYAITCA